jgi:hypothetical protein
VLVRVPIHLVGEGERTEATFRYRLGSFVGRDTALAPLVAGHTTLRLRIPQELFRSRERLVVEVLEGSATDPDKILWTKHWDVSWRGKAPALEPVSE